MTWRLARALETLRAQVNAKFPNRSKNSDGTKGDDAHASRKSDHTVKRPSRRFGGKSSGPEFSDL